MNEKKIIKDLKDRNDKLKMQYDYNNIHFIALLQKYDRQTKQLQAYKDKEDKLREYADDKREEFNEVIRYYLDDNLIGNEDEVNKLREFRSWFMEILEIIGDE